MSDATGGASAPLARLRGVHGWENAVVQGDGQRWVTLVLNLIDADEPFAIALDPRDARMLGLSLLDKSVQANARNAGERN